MKPIDLRSDTLTQPTDAMRQAMAKARVGDDVYREDPTVIELERAAAEKLGKEAALFVPSGTMGNLISLLTHCGRGEEVLLGDRSHIFLNEVGGLSALGGMVVHLIANEEDGTLPLPVVEKSIRHKEIHYPPTGLICLENTHNYCHGSPLSPQYMDRAGNLAKRHALRIHLDGARIFNAAVALQCDVKALTRQADSVMFCLSKGLSAPVGSLVAGSGEFIERARKMRKMVGGGMRQAGHLAAAGLEALECGIDRLKEDHINAARLAQGLAALKGVAIEVKNVRTNIVFFGLDHPECSPEKLQSKLDAAGVRILMTDPGVFRAVLHRDISAEQVEQALTVFQSILG